LALRLSEGLGRTGDGVVGIEGVIPTALQITGTRAIQLK
jgi:hypothetical protein